MSRNMSIQGRRNAVKGQSSIVFELTNQNTNYRNELEKKGIRPKNHHKDNLKYIETIAKNNKQKQNEKNKENESKNKRFLLNKFAGIESKIQTRNSLNSSDDCGVRSTASNVASCTSSNSTINHISRNKKNIQNIQNNNNNSNNSNNCHNSNCNNMSTRLKKKENIPSKEELIKINEKINNIYNVKKQPNYIFQNRKKIINSKPKLKESKQFLFLEKENYGKVPKYIIKRRLEMLKKSEQEYKKIENSKIPDGMKKMNENERINTLILLNNNKKNIHDKIEKLPLIIETQSMIKYEKDLQKQLKQIENAIKIFNKKTVYIVK